MQHTIVSQGEWLTARKAHLAREKELTRLRDAIAAERRALPWVKVEKTYEFDTPEGRKSLAFALRFRAEDRTLTAEEASAAREAAVALATARTGAVLRS